MSKSFGFNSQLQIGKMGVQTAKSVFRAEGYEIEDYEHNKELQTRGIDLYVEELGFVEIKTDTHKPVNIFLELSVSDKPGAVDRCVADYYGVLYVYYGKMYLFPRPELVMYLREQYSWLCSHQSWIKTISSHRNNNTWKAKGIIVPLELLLTAIDDIIHIEWDVDEVTIEGDWN